ncbi:MAG: ABC transporter substrate-binding protein [Pseudomonadota bacterium]
MAQVESARVGRRRGAALAAFSLLAVFATAATPAIDVHAASASTLPSVVSTNLCADLFALSLAAPAQLLSVSWKSQDPARSPRAEQARAYAANRASAEEIIHLHPDIVLASRAWRRHPPAARFEALGIRVVVVPLAKTWPEILEVTQWVADQIDRSARGREVVAQTERRLARLAVPAADGRPRSVLYLRPSGGSAGAGSFIDTLLRGAGLTNHATTLGLEGWGRVDLETLLVSPPDLFLLSAYTRDRGYAESQLLRHPAMRSLFTGRRVLRLPTNQGSCSTWHLIETAEYLARQLLTTGAAKDGAAIGERSGAGR